ncbi:MAG: hypothetical protein COA79_09115 [Planctomycetota bacterium]|nr:MAG: hypothetical protein COA79_09115 [Planctomycetota bacterium]
MKLLMIIFVSILFSLSVDAEVKRPATILLICDESHVSSWSKFASWKTSIGKATKIISVKTISEKYKGKDIQEKIRLCCLDHINNHKTKWVILGGDSQPGGKGLVPDRDTYHINQYAQYADLPTDIYYLSEKNWDSNNDGLYGDWNNDKDSISYTNVKASIGRIPVRSKKDIAAYTAKIISHESNYPEKEFAFNLIYTCPMAGAYPKLNTSKKVLESNWKGGLPQQFFGHVTPWDKVKKGDHELLPSNWIDLINKKSVGKMHMHGHGLLNVWVLENHKTVDANSISKLKNENAYLTMTTVSCFTGKYDGVKDPSVTESMLRKEKGGAVIIVAPSREGVPIFHNPRVDFPLMMKGKMDGTTRTLTNFWRHALSEDMTAGDAMRAAKADMIDDAVKSNNFHYLQCELNLLGDPTLDLRARNPRRPIVTVPKELKKGKQKLIVSTDAPGSTICIMNKEIYQVKKTNDKGQAEFEISPKSKDTISLKVSGPSLNVASVVINVK